MASEVKAKAAESSAVIYTRVPADIKKRIALTAVTLGTSEAGVIEYILWRYYYGTAPAEKGKR